MMILMCLQVLFIQLQAQTARTVTGRVVDDKGQPLAGVTVAVKGTEVKTQTTAEGTYTINVPAAARELVFSFVGFAEMSVAIPATGAVNVNLQPSVTEIEGVVITGYNRVKRSTYSGAASRIDKKAIELVPVASFDQLLQGRTPGLLVTSGSGQPGASARLQIRGAASINGGSDPLYVVDGVPVEQGVFQSLNPNDFESVDVLKDATASALYGSRGAAGVIVATTKRGRAGKTVLTYRGQMGMTTTGTQRFEMMNSTELLQWHEMMGTVGLQADPSGVSNPASGLAGWDRSAKNPLNSSLTPAQQAANAMYLDSLRSINTNWKDVFFRKGAFTSHDINLSGGNERTRYFMSGGLYQEEGIGERSDLKRYTFRLNLDHTTDKLNVSINSNIGSTKRNFIESEGGIFLANPFAAVYLALPYQVLYNQDGTLATGSGQTGANAYSRIYDNDQNNQQLKANLSMTANYNLTRNVYAGGQLGLDFRETNNIAITRPNTYSAQTNSFPGTTGSYTETLTRFFLYQTRAYAGYRNVFAGRHSIDVNVNTEFIEEKTKNFGFTGYGLNPKLPSGPAAITPGTVTNQLIPAVTGGSAKNAMFSVFGIAKYIYDDKYTLDLSVRNDQYSLLPEKNRSKMFYSVGANWNVMKENFTENWRNINTLRLRTSYGTSANAKNFPLGNGEIYATYGAGTYAGFSTLVPVGPGLTEADWEYTSQLNIGVDFGAFRDRLNGSLDVYSKVTKNLYLGQQVSALAGLANPTLDINAGKMRNRGIELQLNYEVLRRRQLSWTIGANLAYNQNRILDLGQVNERELGTSIVREGLPIGSHYEVKWAGVDAATGRPLYYTKDGKLTTVYNEANRVAEFGTYNAPFIGGFNTSVRFHGFEIAAFFTFQEGFSRYNNQDYFQLNHAFALQGFNLRREMLTMWSKPGDVTNIQSPLTQREFSSKDIQDASYLRFRNLQASYNIPRSVLGRQKHITAIRIYGQAQNLYTWTKWTGFDPEDANNIATYEYPLPRIYTLGIDVSF